MTSLTYLDITSTEIADLSPLTHLYALAEGGEHDGVSFTDTPAAASDPRLAEIAAILHGGERSKALLDHLAEQETFRLEAALEAALKGPILVESLADIERQGPVFAAVSVERGPEVAADLRHQELLGALQFSSTRLSRANVQNRMGQQVADSFRDYAEQSRIQPLNPRILNLLGNDIRAVLADADLSAGLDGFDLSALRGFMVEHDAFLAEYYPRALLGVRHEVKTDPATLQRELFPQIRAAQKAIAEAEILAPSVGKALEMVERHAEAANRRLMTAHDPEKLAAAQKELNRGAVFAAGFVGRIVVRLRQFVQSEGGRWKGDPLGGLSRAKTIHDVAGIAAHHLTPIFRALWTLVTGTPPPF
ncbi:hypothetical protein [Stagnihabitans tardus]|uniref:Uncharacterized protein n=1 Tax=Stagnihabitans tardus TaxID=2699202 RepID=A0AAE4YBD9_9RHOB|nr:hypothetical protein [Stagnihabitans tardus]NBZ86830.1 hypothetical protein [Stagnihabitans tardus]